MKKTTNLRAVIREELNSVPGIEELTPGERYALEEGIWDRVKAGAAGMAAGASAGLKNAFGGAVDAAKGAVQGGMIGASGKGGTIAPSTRQKIDPAQVKAYTTAFSRLGGMQKQLKKLDDEVRGDFAKMNLGVSKELQAQITADTKAIAVAVGNAMNAINDFGKILKDLKSGTVAQSQQAPSQQTTVSSGSTAQSPATR